MKGIEKKKEKKKEKSESGKVKVQSDYQKDKTRKGDSGLDIKSKKL